jgi:hypothetical protein
MDTEQKEIDHGRRVEQFLEDEAITAAFDKIAGLNYAEFLSATPDKAITIQSRARALEDIKNELRVIVDNGKLAQRKREQRQKAEKR